MWWKLDIWATLPGQGKVNPRWREMASKGAHNWGAAAGHIRVNIVPISDVGIILFPLVLLLQLVVFFKNANSTDESILFHIPNRSYRRSKAKKKKEIRNRTAPFRTVTAAVCADEVWCWWMGWRLKGITLVSIPKSFRVMSRWLTPILPQKNRTNRVSVGEQNGLVTVWGSPGGTEPLAPLVFCYISFNCKTRNKPLFVAGKNCKCLSIWTNFFFGWLNIVVIPFFKRKLRLYGRREAF